MGRLMSAAEMAELVAAMELVEPFNADHIINVLTTYINSERFDIVGETLDILWRYRNNRDIDWSTLDGQRLIKWIENWIIGICVEMYTANDDEKRALILQVSLGCMHSHNIKQICMLYHEFKIEEYEILMEMCDFA